MLITNKIVIGMIKQILFLVLLSLPIAAQTIYRDDEFTKAGPASVNKYVRDNTLQISEVFMSFRKILNSGLLKYSEKPQGISINLYINAKGEIDYLVYSVLKTDIPADTFDLIMKEKLAPAFKSWRLQGLKKNIHTEFMMMFAPEPEEAFGKSSRQHSATKTGHQFQRPKSNDTTVTTLEELKQFVNTDQILKIDLSVLELTSVPEEIYRFKNVKTLNLNGNKMTDVRLDLKRLRQLDYLNLNHNPIQKLKLTRTRQLKNINLQGTGMVRIPRSLKNIRNLSSVWLGFNPKLNLRQRDFKRIRNAEDLNLYACSLSTLSPHIRHLKKLEVLDLYYNQLTKLPESITTLKHLTHLALSNNKLEKLPEDLDKLRNLEYLYLHHNRLSTLPGTITALEKLKVLDIGYNWFYHYPDALGGVRNLSELDLSANNFDKFPQQLLELKNLEKLYLRGNPFLNKESDTTLADGIRELKTNNKEVFH